MSTDNSAFRELEIEIERLRAENKANGEKIDAETKRREAAEAAQKKLAKENAVQNALSGFKFAAPSAVAIANKTFLDLVEDAEDGTFLIQGQPVTSYIETSLSNEYSCLLEQEHRGFQSGSATGPRALPVNLEDADRIMDAKQQAAYAGEIVRQLPNLLRSR